MTAEKKVRRRLEIIATPDWIDLVSEAARRAGSVNVSAYVRDAVNARMVSEGYSFAPAEVRRGRPAGSRRRPK